jgi:ADP-ribosylglycohydrolase
MGNKHEKPKGFVQPLILKPTNKTPLEQVNIEELLSEFEKDPNKYKEYLKKLFFVFNRHKQCDSTVNIITNFIPNIHRLCKKITAIKKENSHDKYMAFSCILGAFLGDALGDDCEFTEYNLENYKQILSPKGPWPPGEITDDSEMALSLCYAIMDSPDLMTLNQKYIFFYHGIWISTNPIAAGGATKNALRLFNYDEHTKLLYNESKEEEENNNKIMEDIIGKIHKINYKTLANGHLMRSSAFHVWYYYLHKKEVYENLKSDDKNNFLNLYLNIKKEIIKDSSLTHPNEEMPIIASIFAFMVQCALFEYKAKEVISKMNVLLSNDIFDQEDSFELKVKKFINDTIEDFKKPKFDKNVYFNNIFDCMGYYVHAMRLSLYYVYDFDNIVPMKGYTKYRSIMNDINNFGGDTDTNSAIVGQIIGPLIGFENFGNKDLTKILNFVSPSRFQYSASMVYFFVDYLEKNCNNVNIKTSEENVKNIPKFNFIRNLLKMIYCKDITKEI